MARLVVPLGLVVAAVLTASLPRAAELPAPTPESTTVKALGVASCAAMACHHGNGPRGSPGSEYSTWVSVDPHARAYRVLFNVESRRMQHALDRSVAAHENPLCLKCHAMGDGVPMAMQSDGVGCERCHGPAGKWKATHYLPGFDRSAPGFKDLRTDLVVRAEVCADCHVGKGEAQVDHDLIAAGHPRLRFEFAGYYASYPRHWGDRHKGIVNDEPRSWLLGELTCAKASLELLAARAADERRPWPEFAEYGCVSCHHGLQADSKPVRSRLSLAEWYTLVPLALGDDPFRQTLAQLGGEMAKRSPERGAVRRDARAAAEALGAWRNVVKDKPFDAAQVRALAAALVRHDGVVGTWDGGAQVYLSLAALEQVLGDRAPLRQMKLDLIDAFPQGARPRSDTPTNYSPTKLRQTLEQVRKRLE